MAMDAETPVAGNWLPDDGSAQSTPPGSDGAMGAGGEWGQAVHQDADERLESRKGLAVDGEVRAGTAEALKVSWC
jgi:hypothetical protein